MSTTTASPESLEAARIGKQIYAERIRADVEAVPANIGKIVLIDVDSGDYEVDADLLRAADRLRNRRPDGRFFAVRAGYNAVYTLGGTLTRTQP
jgi:hypothetical protein